jgi:hypothetical protein
LKFIWFWEYDPADIYDMFEKDTQAKKLREEDAKRLPKVVFPAHWLGMEHKGFTIFEVDDPQQLVNMAAHFFPQKRSKFVPIFEKAMVQETYRKVKK